MIIFGPININGIIFLHVKGVIPPSFWQNEPHSHDHCEIFIHEKGEFDVFVEKTTYKHSSKEIRVYAPGELHFGSCSTAQEMEWFQLSVNHEFFKQHKQLGEIIIDREYGKNNVFTCKQHNELVSLALEIEEKFKQHSPLATDYFISNVTKIFCIINEKSNFSSVGTTQNKNLQEIIRIINDNYVTIHSAKDLYNLTHFSISYIHKLFKTHLNITPHRFILLKKLNHARALLLSGASVTEACLDVGFSDYSNFITLFKKNYGTTPNKVRMKN